MLKYYFMFNSVEFVELVLAYPSFGTIAFKVPA